MLEEPITVIEYIFIQELSFFIYFVVFGILEAVGDCDLAAGPALYSYWFVYCFVQSYGIGLQYCSVGKYNTVYFDRLQYSANYCSVVQ